MSQVNYTLKYRPISELISEIQLYLQKYSSTAVIQPSDIIDSAWKVTYDLGLRVFNVNEDIVDIYHYHGKLPDAFFSLNYAFLCGHNEVYESEMSAPHLEAIPYTPDVNMPCTPSQCGNNDCTPPRRVYTVCNGNQYEIVQIIGMKKHVYKTFVPVKLKHYSGITKLCNGCPNINENSPYQIDIRNGFIYANIENAKLYINYLGYPTDEYGNMLIPDHPYINEYYKYAALRRIVELLILNGTIQPDILSYIEIRHRESRNNAVSFVNTPNFSELKELHKLNRKIQHAKYYDFFKRL